MTPVAWSLDEPLTTVSFFRDWDYCTSAFATLRYYWLSHGTIPQWNLAMCGGKPELANPASLTFTWPSLFAYALPPIWALLALATVMTALGLVSMWLLLRSFGAAPLAATVGASLYAINGYFASHFNQGHITFVLFHLVPLMILLFERCLRQRERGEHSSRGLLAVGVVSAMFFSAAIPHPLFHFYPVFILYVLTRCGLMLCGGEVKRALRHALTPCMAHLMGLWLAAYKLGPMIIWQLAWPRRGVVDEKVTLPELAGTFVRFVTDYYDAKAFFPGQIWGYWEYNAYIGPVAAVAAMVGVVVVMAGFRQFRRGGVSLERRRQAAWGMAAILCVAIGLLLSLGNKHFASPAQAFQYLPLVSGIRVFGRYHAITLFGVAVLNAAVVTSLLGSMPWRRLGAPARRILAASVFTLACVPPMIQWGYLVWNIKGIPYGELTQRIYTKLVPLAEGANPMMVKPWRQGFDYTTQTYLLDHGYFSAECYEPLSGRYVDLSKVPVGSTYPMTTAPSFRLTEVQSGSFGFAFDDALVDKVEINLALLPTFTASIPGKLGANGFLEYEPEQLRGKTLTITTTMPADVWSAAFSMLGLALACALGLMHWRREALGLLPSPLIAAAASPLPERGPR